MCDSELELIDVRWVWDDLEGWVLVATEPAPRGEPDGTVDHWMKDEGEEG